MSNLGVSFGTLGYVLHLSNSLNSKIANVDKKLHGHLEWHRARDR